MTKRLAAITPGEILAEEFLHPLGLSQNQLARAIDVPVARVNDIIHGRRGISADTALRLGRLFGTTAEFWLNLQSRHDLKVARQAKGAQIERSVAPLKAA